MGRVGVRVEGGMSEVEGSKRRRARGLRVRRVRKGMQQVDFIDRRSVGGVRVVVFGGDDGV